MSRSFKVPKELLRILEECSREVSKWPDWKRSLDPIGDAGKEKYGKRKLC